MGSLRLTLLRHGHADPSAEGAPDFERELSQLGAQEASQVAARLAAGGSAPDLILASSSRRTRATAAIVAADCALRAEQVRFTNELYLASPEMTWELLTGRDWEAVHVLICGHNPGLSQLASRLGPAPQARQLATAGVVSAVWQTLSWSTLRPGAAVRCEAWDVARGS